MISNFKVDILIGGITVGLSMLGKYIIKSEFIPVSSGKEMATSFAVVFVGSVMGRSIIDETAEKMSGIRKRLMERIKGGG